MKRKPRFYYSQVLWVHKEVREPMERGVGRFHGLGSRCYPDRFPEESFPGGSEKQE
jgi:hypothetical protein